MLFQFAKAMMIGLAIAAPVGPIGILYIRRAVAGGFTAGFSSGMGAAVADGVYGAIAAFGLIALDRLTGGFGGWEKLAGGAILIWMGTGILRRAGDLRQEAPRLRDHARGFVEIFLLTLSNPATILSFLAIFAGLGVSVGSGIDEKLALIIGVFLGSALWWLTLSGIAAKLRHRLSDVAMKRINWVSGIVICGFALAALVAGGRDLLA